MRFNTFFLRFSILTSLFHVMFSIEHAKASFYQEHAKGWFWYEDPTIEKEEKKRSIKQNQDGNITPLSPLKQAKEDLKAYKEKLEETKALALMEPTFVNVKNYMTLQKDMSDRAEQFSKTWMQVVLQTPQLNPEIKNPTAQYMRHVKNDEEQRQRDHILKKAAKTYGLFLFVSHGCNYCKAFAPIVKQFADQYGFDVMVVSLQGQADQDILSLFANVKPNNGMAEVFGIDQAPALMAYNPKTEDVIPISYGATSMDRLIENFITLIKGGRGV